MAPIESFSLFWSLLQAEYITACATCRQEWTNSRSVRELRRSIRITFSTRFSCYPTHNLSRIVCIRMKPIHRRRRKMHRQRAALSRQGARLPLLLLLRLRGVRKTKRKPQRAIRPRQQNEKPHCRQTTRRRCDSRRILWRRRSSWLLETLRRLRRVVRDLLKSLGEFP